MKLTEDEEAKLASNLIFSAAAAVFAGTVLFVYFFNAGGVYAGLAAASVVFAAFSLYVFAITKKVNVLIVFALCAAAAFYFNAERKNHLSVISQYNAFPVVNTSRNF